MNTIAELVGFVRGLVGQGRTKDEVYEYLDRKAEQFPNLEHPVAVVKAFVDPLFTTANVDDKFTNGITEVLTLLRTNYGPVSDAPEIGLA